MLVKNNKPEFKYTILDLITVCLTMFIVGFNFVYTVLAILDGTALTACLSGGCTAIWILVLIFDIRRLWTEN